MAQWVGATFLVLSQPAYEVDRCSWWTLRCILELTELSSRFIPRVTHKGLLTQDRRLVLHVLGSSCVCVCLAPGWAVRHEEVGSFQIPWHWCRGSFPPLSPCVKSKPCRWLLTQPASYHPHSPSQSPQELRIRFSARSLLRLNWSSLLCLLLERVMLNVHSVIHPQPETLHNFPSAFSDRPESLPRGSGGLKTPASPTSADPRAKLSASGTDGLLRLLLCGPPLPI